MFQVGTACYSTAVAALTASASTQTGAVVVDGGISKVVAVTGVTNSTITYSFTRVSDGVVSSITVPVEPMPCGLLTASDALEISWMIAISWISVFAVSFLIKSMRGDAVDNYGNT